MFLHRGLVIPGDRMNDVWVGDILAEPIQVKAALDGNPFHHCELIDVEPVTMSSVQERQVEVFEPPPLP